MSLKTVAIIALLMAALPVKADYLYWQVTPTEADNYWAFARVGYGENGSYTAISYEVDDCEMNVLLREDAGKNELILNLAGVVTPDQWLYVVEAYNSDGNVVGRSDALSYSQLANCRFGNILSPEVSQVWAPQVLQIPEPTSAVLMLLGLAGLALKRKGEGERWR